jgi:hypothetical protein
MKRPYRFSLRIASGLLLSAALFACDTGGPVATDDVLQQAHAWPLQCTEVNLDAVYSGPPAREHGLINLNDQFVYVEVHDVEAYLPRPGVTADDVRLGDSWETGTPAQSFEVLDINDDGSRDIRLVFSKSRLVADGNLDQNTTEVQVWGLDRTAAGEYCGSEPVEVVLPPPLPGQDVVVFNDVNPFDDTAMTHPGTDNPEMMRNLVTFTSDGPRNNGNLVWWDFGKGSICVPFNCLSFLNVMRQTIEDEGFTVTNIFSTPGSLVDIPIEVKTIFLWTPIQAYADTEINALKQFASEGGRIVFVGEHAGVYGDGIPNQNDFLARMGAVMRNIGDAVDCGYTTLPSESIREHQVTDGVNSLRIACASVIEPGPQDFVLFLDTTQTRVLAGVARIDTTPIRSDATFARPPAPIKGAPAGVNPRTLTGQ